jgi:hypothetical protein
MTTSAGYAEASIKKLIWKWIDLKIWKWCLVECLAFHFQIN